MSSASPGRRSSSQTAPIAANASPAQVRSPAKTRSQSSGACADASARQSSLKSRSWNCRPSTTRASSPSVVARDST